MSMVRAGWIVRMVRAGMDSEGGVEGEGGRKDQMVGEMITIVMIVIMMLQR